MKPNQYKGRPLLNCTFSVFSILSLLCMKAQFQNMFKKMKAVIDFEFIDSSYDVEIYD